MSSSALIPPPLRAAGDRNNRNVMVMENTLPPAAV